MSAKKRKACKALLVMLALALVIGCAIGGTLAWLAMATPPVTNTFTAGNVSITLKETGAVGNQQSFKMVPGRVITKDPEIIVGDTSEPCYVFLKVTKSARYDEFIDSEIDGAWISLDGEAGVYYQKASAKAVLNILVGDKVTVNHEVTNKKMNEIDSDDVKITFSAYAVQSENVADAKNAWDLVKDETPATN